MSHRANSITAIQAGEAEESCSEAEAADEALPRLGQAWLSSLLTKGNDAHLGANAFGT